MAKGDGLSLSSPKFLAIKAVIESPEGKAGMVRAVADSQPALCGVDEILTRVIRDYADHQSIMSAGSIVADCMRSLGYTKGKLKDCPKGCTAVTGTMWLLPTA